MLNNFRITKKCEITIKNNLKIKEMCKLCENQDGIFKK